MAISAGFIQYYDNAFHYWVGVKDPEVVPSGILIRQVDWTHEASLDSGSTWDPVLLAGRDWGFDLTPL